MHATALHLVISVLLPIQPGSPSLPFKQIRILVRSPTLQGAEHDVSGPHLYQSVIIKR